jgi:CheY-like chemotaxis protein/signal transduction histidine kinase
MNPVVLIVDDEPSAREILRGILFNRGYDIILAENGMEALKKAKEIKPDLILLDVMMPEMDGFEVCRHLRDDPILAEVPVIMTTALDDQDSYIKGIEAGADDFVSKPYNRVKLRTRVKTITKLNRYRNLHQERAKFEWVVEEADDGYIMLNNKEEILYANPKARFYLDLPEDRNVSISETFIEQAKKQYRLEPEQGWDAWLDPYLETCRYLIRPETENSSAFWLQADLMEISSGLEDYLIRLRNVTDKIEARENVWKFHSLISHKLRTPLTLLDMIFQFLKTDRNFSSKEYYEHFMDEACNAAVRIKEQLLDITDSIYAHELLKPSAGKCSIREITAMAEEIKIETGIKLLSISYERIFNQDDIAVSFSPPAMEMILRELFINAKKFHHEHSPSIEINISSLTEEIRLKVIDDGVHLTPEQLTSMWIPYNQAEKYFTGEIPGMGLGLSTIASIVWSAGGKCKSYNRKDGAGIIIEITFPCAMFKETPHS